MSSVVTRSIFRAVDSKAKPIFRSTTPNATALSPFHYEIYVATGDRLSKAKS